MVLCPCKSAKSEVKVKVMTSFSRFWTETPVWIYIWWWDDAQSLMLLRKGALLFFKVIRQISRSHRQKVDDFDPNREYQSINQSNPVLLKERVRIPRTRRARGAAMLWGRLPLDGVGSCRLFFTDDLHDNLSWVLASDKPHTFKSCFTHSSQVFFGRPGPFLPGTGLDLSLFISPLERMTCPNHLSRRSRTKMARSHIPSLACSSSIDGSSDGLTPQIQRNIARSLRHSRWSAAEVMGQVSVPCNIELRTLELNRRPLRSKGTGFDVSKGRFSRNLPQAHLHPHNCHQHWACHPGSRNDQPPWAHSLQPRPPWKGGHQQGVHLAHHDNEGIHMTGPRKVFWGPSISYNEPTSCIWNTGWMTCLLPYDTRRMGTCRSPARYPAQAQKPWFLF